MPRWKREEYMDASGAWRELKLYGFAICVDDKGKKSINMYFVSREE